MKNPLYSEGIVFAYRGGRPIMDFNPIRARKGGCHSNLARAITVPSRSKRSVNVNSDFLGFRLFQSKGN